MKNLKPKLRGVESKIMILGGTGWEMGDQPVNNTDCIQK